MTINEATVKGKWLEIKGDVQKVWGQLTSDEIEKTKGDIKSLAGLVQQRCGEAQETFQKKFTDLLAPYLDKKDAVLDATKEKLKT